MHRATRSSTVNHAVAAVCTIVATSATAFGCPDTNGDGVVDVQDLTRVILDWGSQGPGCSLPADVDGDGFVDLQDLAAVLLAWGPFECPPVLGACCVDAECVGVTTSDGCAAQAGNWLEAQSCGSIDCAGLPGNDGYFGAMDLGSGDVEIVFDNTNALAAGPDGAPCVTCNAFGDSPGILADLWFLYTASRDTTLQIDTCNPDDPSALDTKLAVYDDMGLPPGPMTDIACNDDDDNDGLGLCTTGPGNQSAVLVPVTAGQTILIRVGGWGTDDSPGSRLGESVLSVIETEPPPVP